MKLSLAVGAVGIALFLFACSSKEEEKEWRFESGDVNEPEGLAVSPDRLPSPTSPGATITLPGGGQIHTLTIDGRTFVPIEATFSEQSWQSIVAKSAYDGLKKEQRDELVRDVLNKVLGKIGEKMKVVGGEYTPSVGLVSAYVPFDQYAELVDVKETTYRLLVNPLVSTPLDRVDRDMKRDEALGFQTPSGFSAFDGLVGLNRMGVPEFLEAVFEDVGSKPDGSFVNLGVVDTGITFAHPAFTDAKGQSRIVWMQDFTGEGRIYFTKAGRFQAHVTTTPGELKLYADYILSPNSVNEQANPAKLEPIEGEIIKVPPALEKILVSPASAGARFGVLSEKAFATKSRGVDLDQNGKTDDLFYAILVPGQNGNSDSVWLSLGPKGDFTKSAPLYSYGLQKQTQQSYLEKIGLDIKKEAILDGAGQSVPVTTAAIVGFDPGNHGSHVTGIAAARKIFSNAPNDTEVRGIAPGARIMSGRICANTGGCRGTKAIADLSAAGAEVINMSIGSLGESNDGYGVQEAVIDRLTMQNGTTFVIAASNDGPGRQTVGSPSVSRYGISVGATASPKIIQQQYLWPGSGKVPGANAAEDDFLLYFSSRGPTAAGGMKPDVTAPGTWLSAIQLNGIPGAITGLNVMWGTSMASPAAAGAVTLLLDAGKRWNAHHPYNPVPIDPRSLRRVILASARPFDVTSIDTKTGERRSGQYTFVDEGFGMINLPRAWEALKASATTHVPSGVATKDVWGGTQEIDLDYQVRVLRTNPNGLAYDGTRTIEGAGGAVEARFGKGVWIEPKQSDSLFRVQVARRLPTFATAAPDIAALVTQLKTSAEELEIETVVHGSHAPWVKAAALNALDCNASVPNAPAKVLIVGEGAVDQPINPTTGAGGSIAQTSSVIHLCVDRSLLEALPPGDHGAIVNAYRTAGKLRERTPAFSFPVYVTVPHRTLVGQAGYKIESSVPSFGVARNYVEVPKGTTIVKVTLDVPAPAQVGTVVTGCAGVSLEALEGGNTKLPPEFIADPSKAVAQNCTSAGKVAQDKYRTVTYTRPAPAAGVWDLHVFGMYSFARSPYTLAVEFARVESSKKSIEGVASALTTEFDVEVLDASYPLAVSGTLTKLTLSDFAQGTSQSVAEGAKLRVPNLDGVIARSYGADVAKVTFSTGDSAGNDLDMEVLECDDEAAQTCKRAGWSAGVADIESVTITPKAGKFYVAEVEGYAIKAGGGLFTLREAQRAKTPEAGTLTMTKPTPAKFSFTTAFDTAASPMFADARYTSGKYTIDGEIDVRDEDNTSILRVPVRIRLQ